MSQSMSARKADQGAERRSHGRLDRVHKLFMQVVDTRQRPAGPLLRCTCENVSSRGIGMTLVEPVEPGARVEIWINVEDEDRRFLLGGVVRWCRPAVHRCLHEVGIELTHGSDDEFVRWSKLWSASRGNAR